jgi:hypothetical protein
MPTFELFYKLLWESLRKCVSEILQIISQLKKVNKTMECWWWQFRSRAFTSGCRTALKTTYCSCLHPVARILSWAGPHSQRNNVMPCLAVPILNMICSVDVNWNNFHNLSVCLFTHIPSGNFFILINLHLLFF